MVRKDGGDGGVDGFCRGVDVGLEFFELGGDMIDLWW